VSTVLAVTSRHDDETFALLSAAMSARGARLVRLNTESFPTGAQLDAELAEGGYRGALTTEDGERVELHTLQSVWLRRLRTGRDLRREGLTPSVLSACRGESDAALGGVLCGLSAPMVNDMFSMIRAESKAYQLSVARRLGLRLPETLISNRAAPIHAFAGQHPALITKMLATAEVRTGSGESAAMPTSAVTAEDLVGLEASLSLSPATFQRRLDKKLEVRAAVVGDRVLAAAVDSQQIPEAEVDWRQGSDVLMDRFEPIELPAALCASLVRLHRVLDLQYGGVDLILTPDDEWVFLETNPAGEWAWVQNTGLDVAGALADVLLSAPRRLL